MIKTLIPIITLGFLLLGSVAYAAQPANVITINKRLGTVTAHNNVGLDSLRTSSSISVEGWSVAKIQTLYTHNAADDVTLTFEESDNGSVWSKITETVSGATAEFSAVWTTNDVNANWTIMLDVTGYTYIRVKITSTSGTSSDLATVYVRSARGI